MSKITQALEKAARERLQREVVVREEDQATAATHPVTVPIFVPGANEAVAIGEIRVDPHIVSATAVKSPIAEQYRILRTNLRSLRLRQTPKTLMVTSAMGGEGKSVTSLNLALTLAQQDRLKVVLVDADLRRSSIYRWLGIAQPAKGLSTVLAEGGTLNGALVKLASPALTILPAGPRTDDPSALLESGSMRRLLSSLKAQFDIVLIDTPPVLSVADASILAAQVDGVLLVVKAGATQLKTVMEARHRLEQMKASVVGCVLTHADHYTPGYYRYYHDYQEETRHDATAIPPTGS